jgi:hypothetical protein
VTQNLRSEFRIVELMSDGEGLGNQGAAAGVVPVPCLAKRPSRQKPAPKRTDLVTKQLQATAAERVSLLVVRGPNQEQSEVMADARAGFVVARDFKERQGATPDVYQLVPAAQAAQREPAPIEKIRQLFPFGGLQGLGAIVQAQRFLESRRVERQVPGKLQVTGRASGLGKTSRFVQVVCQIGDPVFGVPRRCFESILNTQVKLLPPGQRNGLKQRLPNQGMLEAENNFPSAPGTRHKMGALYFVGDIEKIIRAYIRDRTQHVEGEGAADHRRGVESADARSAERLETPADDEPYTVWHIQGLEAERWRPTGHRVE